MGEIVAELGNGEDRVQLPVLRPVLPNAECLLPYLKRIDLTRVYSNYGPLSSELERRLEKLLRLPEGGLVCASSGTAALMGAILATAGPASPARPLALLPAFTFAGTAIAVERCGYKPYLADIDPKMWMLDPTRIASHPEQARIGLVIPVAAFGRPVPQLIWQSFQARTGIPVVIDGAASFDCVSEAPEKCLGKIPVTLSFHATKSFSTGEGGAVITTDFHLTQRIVRALNFGFFGSRDSQSASLNGKMSEYHAAVGLAELDGWTKKNAALRGVAETYRRSLRQFGLADLFHGAPDLAGCYALFCCSQAEEAERAQHALRQRRVEFRLWYGSGLHKHTYFASLPREPLSVTDDLAPRLLGLPIAPDLPSAAVERVVGCLAQA